MNPYNPYSFNQMSFNQTLQPQQILTANGRASVDNIKLAPNSSVLVADSMNPIVYKCVSDSIGNVSVESFDISKHKDEEQIKKEQTELILADLLARIERLENESNTKRNEPDGAVYEPDKANDEYGKERKQSSSYGKPNASKQS